jgi:uncharacterized HAD superfamily protein
MATIIIDLDGTICSEEKTYSRSLAILKEGAKESIRKLKENNGYKIIIYSARSWQEYEMTENWLQKNEIIYDQLILGKPIGDYWIDDRAIEFTNWEKICERVIK